MYHDYFNIVHDQNVTLGNLLNYTNFSLVKRLIFVGHSSSRTSTHARTVLEDGTMPLNLTVVENRTVCTVISLIY